MKNHGSPCYTNESVKTMSYAELEILNRASVHWSGYDATALDIEADPQRCRFGSRKSDFALQALVECSAIEPK